jgi:hypothetical protein
MLPTPLYFSPLHHQHHFSLLGVYFRLEAKSSQSASEVEKKSSSISLPLRKTNKIYRYKNEPKIFARTTRYDRRCVVCRLVRVINRIIYVSRTYRSAHSLSSFSFLSFRPLLWCSVPSLVTLRNDCKDDGMELRS